jgi:hypothetical protein
MTSCSSLTTVNGTSENEMVHAQAIVRDTTILDADGFLGPHSPISLNVGDAQSFVFKPGDKGLFYLTPEQRQIQWYNRPTGKIKRVERSKSCLLTL